MWSGGPAGRTPARVLAGGAAGSPVGGWPDQVSLGDEASGQQPQALGGVGDKI